MHRKTLTHIFAELDGEPCPGCKDDNGMPSKPPAPPHNPTHAARAAWAAALRDWRGSRSQAEVAALLGVSERSWYRWEDGQMPGPVPRRLIWGPDRPEDIATTLARIEEKLDRLLALHLP